ncbi:PREDICTED: uncharacterized protein LOC109589477 [Amphimedon queenslandica]|uniref:Uncharacterized protein n=1 Tax=Amphimedon queenslandica TaxID=400682 RepID=A0AAN0JVC4_AMPQE|nr:PREDICTED: uncharacterized protein LOC109589477 [Amphimedon queenslandica]|eukprot:XP_019861114.1 PREDICTED: uncharacterized protein LOC109589477 [Amphimedon queenslandica]
MNIKGLISVPQYQQCNISIVFSNEAGSSEPFILAFNTTPTMNPTLSPTSTVGTTTSSPNSIITRPEIIGISVGGGVLLIITIQIIVIVVVVIYKKGERKKSPLLERIVFDGSSARTSVSSYNECGTYSQAQEPEVKR